MHLARCKDQKSATLDEFYAEVSEQNYDDSRACGKAMLDLIERLRALPSARRVYGLTSHYRLCLLAEDASTSPWFVIFFAVNKHTYFVEYLMPENLAPWPLACVRGQARSEDEAVRMILTAMERSEGWNKQ